jgi:hypothetical protein
LASKEIFRVVPGVRQGVIIENIAVVEAVPFPQMFKRVIIESLLMRYRFQAQVLVELMEVLRGNGTGSLANFALEL